MYAVVAVCLRLIPLGPPPSTHTHTHTHTHLPCLCGAEFWGTLLFQMFGGSAPNKDTSAPAANGFALVAAIYAFCNISGGHLNPAVTFALMCTGHMKWWKALMYMCAQVRGKEGGRERAERGEGTMKAQRRGTGHRGGGKGQT